MIEKDIDKIDESDLNSLIDDEVSEGKTIEYKEILSGNSDKEKKEFLADVSSFANSSGGDLFIGIVEKKGVATEVKGIKIDDTDKEKLRLEQIIRNGISKRIPSITIRAIKLTNQNTVFIIRIPQSWISPHRVVYGGHDKFYSRNSSGKYPLDVEELRIAFNLSETIKEKIRNFRMDRISKNISNETPVPLVENAKVILHLIPLSSFSRSQNYDINIAASDPVNNLSPIYGRAHDWRYNYDGYLTYCSASTKEGLFRSYVQLFRNGIIEAVEGWLLRPRDSKLLIPSIRFEELIIESLSQYLKLLKALNVIPPIFIFLTLLGVKGFYMETGRRFHVLDEELNRKIDRDILSTPELIIENYKVEAKEILRPCFDVIWNACGYEKSLNYDDKGEWNPK